MNNDAHLHLVLNHLPILGVLFGLLTMIGGYLLKNPSVKRTALGMFVFSAVCAIPAYLTGEPAEEVVEGLPGVTEYLVETHEELANLFLWVVGALGLLSLATLYTDLKSKKFASSMFAITFVAALGSMVLAQRVGSSGGEIRHTEIRTGVAAAAGTTAGEKASTQEDDD
jgi:hypothetical protein